MRVLSALQTKFALRSGGHKSAPGFASVGSDGVLIALQNLNNLAITSDKKVVTTGTGNRWRDVYSFVKPQGVLVVGGRVSQVGVGGYMLGGIDVTRNLEYTVLLEAYHSRDRWCQSFPKHVGPCIGPCVTFPGTLLSVTLIAAC